MASTPTLASLLAASPRHLPATELHARLELLESALQAYRAELSRRPSHCQQLPPKKPALASPSEMPLLSLPPELVARVLSLLEAPSLAACSQASSAFVRHTDAFVRHTDAFVRVCVVSCRLVKKSNVIS